MENGYVILGIVALLFLSMYGYSYATVVWENMKLKKEKKREARKEELIQEKRLLNQKIREEKFQKFNKRKEEIKHELMLLEKMKEKQKVG